MTLLFQNAFKSIMVLIAVLFLREAPGRAELHISELKGLSEMLQLSERCHYLRPENGAFDRYGGLYINAVNYAPNSRDQNSHPSEEFIQSLFSVPPGTDNPIFLRTSPLSRKLGRFFSPTTIGKVLAVIETSDPVEQPQALKESLGPLITGDPDFQALVQRSMDEAKEILKQRNALEDQLTLKNRLEIEKLKADSKEEIEKLKQENKRLLSENKDYKRLTDQYTAHRYDKSYLNSFLEGLIKSLQAERIDIQNRMYPKHFTEQVLLTLAWLNTPEHDKSYFAKLYSELPAHCFKNEIHPKFSDSVIKERYTAADYQKLKDKVTEFSETNRARYLIEHPEETAFLLHGKRFFDPDDIPILAYKSVALQHPTKGKVSFPDCMDSSILNFLSILAKDPSTALLSGKPLQKGLKEKGFRLRKEIESFFDSHQDPSSLDTVQAHEEWAPLVSFLPRVHYKNSDYEVKSEIDNILKVMEHFIQSVKEGASSLFQGLSTRKEKLDKLCDVLSRDDLDLSWTMNGSQDELNSRNHIPLLFSIDEEPAFEWRVNEGHSELASVRSDDDWALDLDQRLSNVVGMESKSVHSVTDLDYKIVAGFISESSHPLQVAENLGIKPFSNEYLLFQKSMRLVTAEAKLALAESVMVHYPNDSAYVKRLIQSIPVNDIPAQSFVMNFMIKHGLDQHQSYQKEFENAVQVLKSAPRTAVLFSARKTLVGTLQFLKSQNIPFNVADARGNNPLHLLAEDFTPSIEGIRLVVSSNPELLKKENDSKRTPIQKAIATGKTQIVTIFLEEMKSRGIDLNSRSHHTLSFAVALGDLEMITLLAKQENKTLRQAVEGYTVKSKKANALDPLIKRKNIDFLKYLFTHERDLFMDLLSQPSESGSPFKLLSEETRNDREMRESDFDAHYEFIEKLIDEFPEIFTLKEPKTGETLLHSLVQGGRPQEVEAVLRFLGARIKDPFFFDSEGASPLHRVAASVSFSKEIEEIVKALFKANPTWATVRDKADKVPGDYARTPEMIQLFEEFSPLLTGIRK